MRMLETRKHKQIQSELIPNIHCIFWQDLVKPVYWGKYGKPHEIK